MSGPGREGGAQEFQKFSKLGLPRGAVVSRSVFLNPRGSVIGGIVCVLVVVVVVVVILCWLESASNAVRVTSTFPY